jgi:hypothetical protein
MDTQALTGYRFEQMVETLQLLQRLVGESAAPAQRRFWVQEHCRRHNVSERWLWHSLAVYQEGGTSAVLAEQPQGTVFGMKRDQLRETILARLSWAPKPALAEFCQLLRFSEEFVDRMRFLADWVLGRFLDEAEWVDPERAALCSDLLTEELRQDLEALRTITDSPLPFSEMLREYDEWLMRQSCAVQKGWWR